MPLGFYPQLPKQKRIHIRELFDLLGHRLPRTMPRLALDPQQNRPRAAHPLAPFAERGSSAFAKWSHWSILIKHGWKVA